MGHCGGNEKNIVKMWENCEKKWKKRGEWEEFLNRLDGFFGGNFFLQTNDLNYLILGYQVNTLASAMIEMIDPITYIFWLTLVFTIYIFID